MGDFWDNTRPTMRAWALCGVVLFGVALIVLGATSRTGELELVSGLVVLGGVILTVVLYKLRGVIRPPKILRKLRRLPTIAVASFGAAEFGFFIADHERSDLLIGCLFVAQAVVLWRVLANRSGDRSSSAVDPY